jgi:hypothetical protein
LKFASTQILLFSPERPTQRRGHQLPKLHAAVPMMPVYRRFDSMFQIDFRQGQLRLGIFNRAWFR